MTSGPGKGLWPGDLVWLYNPRKRRDYSPKLEKPWDEQYEIVAVIKI